MSTVFKNNDALGPQDYAATVFSAHDVAGGLRVLGVTLEGGASLPFRAGQYAELGVGDHPPRAFSIASVPGDPVIEFHIRNAGGGVSAAMFALAPGAPLRLRAPLGRNVLQDTGAPVLALAGGVGIAPLKSMVETYLRGRGTAPLRLYWGVRDAGELYLDAHFQNLAAADPRFSYVPLVADGPGARRGLPVPAAIEDLRDLAGCDIYISGPFAMSEAALAPLQAAGAERARIFSDAFSR